jgi:hypothetical protein
VFYAKGISKYLSKETEEYLDAPRHDSWYSSRDLDREATNTKQEYYTVSYSAVFDRVS